MIAIFSMSIFITAFVVNVKRINTVLTLVYIFLTMIFLYSIIIGTKVHNSNYAVSFFVIQFAAPVFFLDKSRRMGTFIFIMTLFFCHFSIGYKPKEIYEVDVLDSICFFILSFFSSIYLSKLKIKQYSLVQLIAMERDTDGLTGILNKSALTREITVSLNQYKKGILMILDCDNFKGINDNYGHDMGDYVLAKISEHLKKIFRGTDIFGRFGGDEFIIFLPGTDNVEFGRGKAQYLLDLMNNTIFLPEQDSSVLQSVGGSIGLAAGSGDNVTFGSLFKCADNALYEAKHLGKNQVAVSTKSANEAPKKN